MEKPSWNERKKEFLNKLRTNIDIESVEKSGKSPNLISITTDSDEKTLYLHYSKWFKEPDGDPVWVYFQGSWNITKSADRPLFHVFLGPSEHSIRVVSNDELMSSKFDINPDHDNGKKWRLSENDGSNQYVLDEFDGISRITD